MKRFLAILAVLAVIPCFAKNEGRPVVMVAGDMIYTRDVNNTGDIDTGDISNTNCPKCGRCAHIKQIASGAHSHSKEHKDKYFGDWRLG